MDMTTILVIVVLVLLLGGAAGTAMDAGTDADTEQSLRGLVIGRMPTRSLNDAVRTRTHQAVPAFR